jgi:hypothetical protein
MATSTGKDGAVYVGSNAIAELRDWSIEESSEMVADTTMGDTWVSNKPTTRSWTASFNVYWDPADTNGQAAMDGGSELTLNFYPTGNTSGLSYWTGDAIVASVSTSASFDGMIEASYSVTGNGALTLTTVA